MHAPRLHSRQEILIQYSMLIFFPKHYAGCVWTRWKWLGSLYQRLHVLWVETKTKGTLSFYWVTAHGSELDRSSAEQYPHSHRQAVDCLWCSGSTHPWQKRSRDMWKQGTCLWLAAIDTQFHMDVKGLLPQDKYLITCNRQAVNDMSATGQKTWLNSILITQEIYKSLIESETQQLCKQPYGCTVGWIIGTYIIHICLPLPRVKALQDWKLFYTITFLEVFPCGE